MVIEIQIGTNSKDLSFLSILDSFHYVIIRIIHVELVLFLYLIKHN